MSAQATVLQDMLRSLVGQATAEHIVREALAASQRSALPASRRELLSFVRAHVVERLVPHTGARPALEFVESCRHRAALTVRIPAATATVRSPRAVRAAVVSRDPVLRVELGRALLQASAEVDVGRTFDELAADTCDVLIAGVESPEDVEAFDALAGRLGVRATFALVAAEDDRLLGMTARIRRCCILSPRLSARSIVAHAIAAPAAASV
jgi:hypothetical protein